MMIRKFELTDAEKFWRLQKALDQETKFMMYEPDERLEDFKRMESLIQNAEENADFLLAADHDGEIVGFISAQKGMFHRKKHSAYVVVGIRKAFQGRGIGSEFFKRLDEWAREEQLKRLGLTVMTSNEAGLRLYLKHGFVIEGMKRASMLVDGVFVDEYYMGKVLNEVVSEVELPVVNQLKAYNQGDIEAFIVNFAENCVVEGGEGNVMMQGRETMYESYKRMFEASPDLFCRLVSRTVVGDYVLDEERVTGRAGNDGESHVVAVYRVESGQIQHVRFLR